MKLSKLPFKVEYLLGAVMILFGTYAVVTTLDENGPLNWIFTFARSLTIFFGLVIILDTKKNVMRAVGIFAISLGASRALLAINSIYSSSDMTFMLGLTLFGLGISLMICGTSYLRGVSKNTQRMTLFAFITLLLYGVVIAFELHWGGSLINILQADFDIVAFILMYIMFIVLLTSDEVVQNTPREQMYSSVRGLELSNRIGSHASIHIDDFTLIEKGFYDRSSWIRVNDGGPVESELVIKIHGEDSGFMMMQKWSGSDDLHATITSDPNGSFIQGNRFSINSVTLEEHSLKGYKIARFHTVNGVAARFMIEYPEEAE